MDIGSVINASAPTVVPQSGTQNAADIRPQKALQISNASAVRTEQSVSQTAKSQASREDIENAVKEVNNFLKPLNNSLQFNIDDDTGETVIKVIDSSTKEVIRQFPSEEMLTIAKAIDKMKGLLIQQKV